MYIPGIPRITSIELECHAHSVQQFDECAPTTDAKKTDLLAKTYDSGDSLVVTHLTTNPPVQCLYMAERTGSLILIVLWSYVKEQELSGGYKVTKKIFSII